MATKKAAPKKAVKTVKPVAKVAKPAPKPAKKSTSKAAPAKKVAPKSTPASKPVKKVTVKETKPAAKKAAPPAPAKKAATPAKAAPKAAAPPVKKPAVAAKTTAEVKPAVKPIEAPVAKEAPIKAAAPKPAAPAKPAKPVVIPKTTTTKAVKYEPDFMKSVLDKQAQQETGPTMRYSDGELIEFRELINRKLETAKRELAYLQGLITRKDESGDLDEGRYMTMEDGSMSMEREQLSQMASRQIQFIDHLEKAIMRIENKTYGICRVTGKLIDKARLRAVPHATLSMEAKTTMSK